MLDLKFEKNNYDTYLKVYLIIAYAFLGYVLATILPGYFYLLGILYLSIATTFSIKLAITKLFNFLLRKGDKRCQEN